MLNKIIGIFFFLFTLFFSFYFINKNLETKDYKLPVKNYQLPFVTKVENLLYSEERKSLCNYISFSQNAYQQCLYSVEGIKPSMLKKLTIAVIDSGVDTNHYYFKGLISKKSKSFVSKTIKSEINHGTHVAGILVKNLLEISFKYKLDFPFELLIVKVIEKSKNPDIKKRERYPYVADANILADAVDYSISQGADIINISIFGEETTEKQSEVFKQAENSGVPIVVAAGNLTTDLDFIPGYPCSFSYSNIYCVGNITDKAELSVSSNFGKNVRFYSLGSNILSTVDNYSWEENSGTSMAAPKVAAVMSFSKMYNIPVSDFYGNYLVNNLSRESLFLFKNLGLKGERN